MKEHLLFLQAAGSDFGKAHDLVDAVAEAIRAPLDAPLPDDNHTVRNEHPGIINGASPRRLRVDPERIAERVERTGCKRPESLLVALAALLTAGSPLRDADLDWIASAAGRIANPDLLLETAGVAFAFNAVNRIADARRVQLEYRFLREMWPFQGWVERRLASLTGLAYDMSYKHQPRHSSKELLDRLAVVFERLGAPGVPDVFHWLSRSPVVLEGILEMIEVSVMHAGVRRDLFQEAAAIGMASRAMMGSGLSRVVENWLPQGFFPDSKALRSWAAPPRAAVDFDLVSACRRYAWQVANAAYTITDEQIRNLLALGLSDAEILDLTLATALFSALAIIEPIGAAVAPVSIAAA